jgi:hypothetical protein
VESAPTAVGDYALFNPPRLSPLAKWHWAGCGLWAAGLVALGIALGAQARKFGSGRVSRSRNFYGVLTVARFQQSGWNYLKLAHGHTAHGLQLLDPARAAWPTLYYSERSGVGLALRALPAGPRRIGVVGLGTGTLAAAYAEAGRFPEAVATAEMACTLATQAVDQALLARNQQLLELYRARKPYHEPVRETR